MLLATALLLISTCALAVLSFLANVKMASSIKTLRNLEIPNPPEWPKLSIVVPACNEADTIGPALETLRALTYPNFEIVLINDRSTDATGEIMERARAADPRINLIHVTELPDGWLGKVNALRLGTAACTGELVLFTDADVIFAKDALTRAVAYFQHRKLDHLCIVPDISSRSFLASMLIATALRGIALSQRPWHTENPKKKETIGGGAFNLVRRSFFEATPGFEWLRLEVADDIGLAHLMKQSGGRPSVVIGHGLVGVEWYPSLCAAIRGMEKNGFSQIARYSLIRGLLIALMLAVAGLGPFVALFHPFVSVQIAGLVAIASGLGSAVLMAVWTGSALAPSILSSPGGELLVSCMIVRSTLLGVQRGGLIWRGTVYPTAQLRSGARVKF